MFYPWINTATGGKGVGLAHYRSGQFSHVLSGFGPSPDPGSKQVETANPCLTQKSVSYLDLYMTRVTHLEHVEISSKNVKIQQCYNLVVQTCAILGAN